MSHFSQQIGRPVSISGQNRFGSTVDNLNIAGALAAFLPNLAGRILNDNIHCHIAYEMYRWQTFAHDVSSLN